MDTSRDNPLLEKLVTICRVLRALDSMRRCCTDFTATAAQLDAALVGRHDSETVANDDALVLQLIQQVALKLDSIALPDDCPLVHTLRTRLAAGCPTLARTPLITLLALQPLSTIHHCYSTTLSLLQSIVSPSTCLTLLHTAYVLDATTLFGAALSCSVGHFATALVHDSNGLALLRLPVLKALLQDDRLQVESEVQVFEAVAAWVAANPAHRLPLLQPLFEMPTHHLAALDQHPLISSSPTCTRIVAHAYLARYVGCSGAVPSSRSSLQQPHAAQEEVDAAAHSSRLFLHEEGDAGEEQEVDMLGCEAQLGVGPSSWDLPGSPSSKRRRTACRGSPGGVRRALVLA